MKSNLSNLSKLMTAAVLTAATLAPARVLACACGCGIFDVGTGSMLPDGPGGMAFLELSYQDQYKNWSGNSRAPAANNDDKEIRTLFVTSGLEYFFNRSWGVMAEVPYDFRTFKTASGDPNAPADGVAAPHWNSIGDIRLKGLYTGFSKDMSTGITLGVKLPTGSFAHNDAFGDIDRDSELGTGSTDVLIGAYHRHDLTKDGKFTLFGQLDLDLPVLIQDDYRPGWEANAALGLYYNGLWLGKLSITPVAQVIGSWRGHDSGEFSSGGSEDDPGEIKSGYQRVLLSPGIEFRWKQFRVYGDVEVPVFQHETGDQLTSPALFKLIFTYHF